MSVSRTTSRSQKSCSNPPLTVTSRSSVVSFASTQRKLHRKEFGKCYADVCHLQHSHPLQAVKQHLERGILDIFGDRIKFDEWYPIVSALRWDQTLHHVAIRLRHRITSPLMDADTDQKARNATKQPALTTKFVLYWLLESIRKCLSRSPTLAVLELDGLPLRGEFVALLAEGVLETRSLQHLSLSKCAIHDDGVEVLSMAVRNAPTIIGLDLSDCNLTEVGALSIAKLISLQKLNRYSEAWKQTLRYRDPDVEGMAGLRRLTLNHNPDIGDRGVQIIAEEVRDDLWLRALDLQDTGLTDIGAAHLIQLVRNNANLTVVDARDNSAMSEESLSEIMAVLAINNADKSDCEYKWLPCAVINSASGEGKKASCRPPVPRPWSSCAAIRSQLRAPPPSSSSSTLQAPTYTRSQSSLTHKETPTWRIQEEICLRENESLRHQVQELGDILNHEMRQKSEILLENQCLKNSLETYRLDKEHMEQEFAKKNVIREETLAVLEKTLSRLAVMCANNFDDAGNDGGDIPELLSYMKAVLSKNTFCKQSKSVKLSLEPLKPGKNWKKESRIQNSLHEQVIWEEDETQSSTDHEKESEKKPNTDSTNKAREIFAKLLSSQKPAVRNYEIIRSDRLGSSSEEESS